MKTKHRSLTNLPFMQLVPGTDRVVCHICIRCMGIAFLTTSLWVASCSILAPLLENSKSDLEIINCPCYLTKNLAKSLYILIARRTVYKTLNFNALIKLFTPIHMLFWKTHLQLRKLTGVHSCLHCRPTDLTKGRNAIKKNESISIKIFISITPHFVQLKLIRVFRNPIVGSCYLLCAFQHSRALAGEFITIV